MQKRKIKIMIRVLEILLIKAKICNPFLLHININFKLMLIN